MSTTIYYQNSGLNYSRKSRTTCELQILPSVFWLASLVRAPQSLNSLELFSQLAGKYLDSFPSIAEVDIWLRQRDNQSDGSSSEPFGSLKRGCQILRICSLPPLIVFTAAFKILFSFFKIVKQSKGKSTSAEFETISFSTGGRAKSCLLPCSWNLSFLRSA